MTDKQIIIDGVDVSGCEYIIPPHKQCPNKTMPYAKETSCFACKEHNTKLNFCKNNPNCYYKQFKRAEKTVEECHKYQAELEDKLEAKEQECEGLKEEIKKHNDDMFKNPPEKRFYCKGCTLPYISKKLKQTLTEIKEITEHCIKQDICTTCDNSDKCHIEDEEIPTYDVCKLILQKISEVGNEN